VTLRWVTRITRWSPPDAFEDVQESGPYASWTHTHRFVPDEQGRGVVMHDRVAYALPFGFLGRIVHRLLVRRQLEAIFDYRERAIDEIFPPGDGRDRALAGRRVPMSPADCSLDG